MPKGTFVILTFVQHPCAKCLKTKKGTSGISREMHPKIFEKMDISKCCLAPIQNCCCWLGTFRCPFCPLVRGNYVMTVMKNEIQDLQPTNTKKDFWSFSEYLRTVESYSVMMARMPHIKEFLIWAAKTHPHVRVEWFNLSKSLGLYQTFLRYQKDLKCLIIHKQLSINKFHPLPLRFNVGFSISVCASELGSKELKMQLVKVLVIRFAGGNLQMMTCVLKRLFAKRVLAIHAE